MCATKNFVSVRLYSAPQSHWTTVAIVEICAHGGANQTEIDRHIQRSYPRSGGSDRHQPNAAIDPGVSSHSEPSAPQVNRSIAAGNIRSPSPASRTSWPSCGISLLPPRSDIVSSTRHVQKPAQPRKSLSSFDRTSQRRPAVLAVRGGDQDQHGLLKSEFSDQYRPQYQI